MALVDDLRLDLGDDDGSVPSGSIFSLHNLLSPTHPDTTAGSPSASAMIVGGASTWGAVASGVESSVWRIHQGQAQWVPTSLPTGNIVGGPGVSTDNAIARWNGTTGQYVQNSQAIVDDSGNVRVPSGSAFIIGLSSTYLTEYSDGALQVGSNHGDSNGELRVSQLTIPNTTTQTLTYVSADGAGNLQLSANNGGRAVDIAGDVLLNSNRYITFKDSTAPFLGTQDTFIQRGDSPGVIDFNTSDGAGGDGAIRAASGFFTIGSFGDGASNSPSIAFSNDPDTGFYRPSDNQIGLVLAGIPQVRWGTNGQHIPGTDYLGFGGSLGSPTTFITNDGTTNGLVQIGVSQGANNGIIEAVEHRVGPGNNAVLGNAGLNIRDIRGIQWYNGTVQGGSIDLRLQRGGSAILDVNATSNGAGDGIIRTGNIAIVGQVSSDSYLPLTNTDGVVVCSGVATVVLPESPVVWQRHIIKDGIGNAGGSPVTVAPSGVTIDGSSTTQISSNYGSITAIFNGTEWSVV